jgi:hypothetical protein
VNRTGIRKSKSHCQGIYDEVRKIECKFRHKRNKWETNNGKFRVVGLNSNEN